MCQTVAASAKRPDRLVVLSESDTVYAGRNLAKLVQNGVMIALAYSVCLWMTCLCLGVLYAVNAQIKLVLTIAMHSVVGAGTSTTPWP